MNKKILAFMSMLFCIAILVAMPIVISGAAQRGDLNGDDSVDMKDILLLRKSVAGQPVDCSDEKLKDVNADGTADMKDILLLRKYVAKQDVSLAPYDVSTASSTESTTSSSITPSGKVTLKFAFTVNGKWEPIGTDNYTWTYNKGDTAKVTIAYNLYQGDQKTNEELLGFVTMDPAFTVVGTPEVGETIDHNNMISIVYSVLMDGDKNLSGSLAYISDEPVYTVTADGQGSTPTQPSQETTTTTTTTQASQPSQSSQATETTQTQATQATQSTQATQTTQTGNLLDNGDFEITDPADSHYGWDKATATEMTIANGVCSVTCGNEDKKSMKQDVEFTPGHIYKFTCDISDYSGTLNFYTNDNGVQKENVSGPSISIEFTATEDDAYVKLGKYNAAFVMDNAVLLDIGIDEDYNPTSKLDAIDGYVFDQVSLAFNDLDASTYGVSWHTYLARESDMLQLVKGTATSATDFASATEFTPSTEVSSSTFCNYSATDFTFDCVYHGSYPTMDDRINRVTLANLDFGTTYSYRVGDKNTDAWSDIYTFTTRPETVGAYSFLWTSDTQYGESNPDAYKSIQAIIDASEAQIGKTPFMLHGGDITDNQAYAHLYRNMLGGCSDFFTSTPVMAAIGNHDSSAAVLVNHWNLSNLSNAAKGYYSFNYGNTHFICLNTEDTYNQDSGDHKKGELTSSQMDWLTADLQNNAKNSNTKWTIVYYHRPLYCPYQENDNKDNGGSTGLEDAKVITRREQLMPLFCEYDVDLVLQAHTHQYYRSYPIDKDGNPQTGYSTTAINGVDCVNNAEGPVFAVISTTGFDPDKILSYTAPEHAEVEKDGQARSFANIFITDNSIIVKGYYLGDTGTNATLYDEFGITK